MNNNLYQWPDCTPTGPHSLLHSLLMINELINVFVFNYKRCYCNPDSASGSLTDMQSIMPGSIEKALPSMAREPLQWSH